MINENLQPISENHSISRVVASIVAPQKFLKPEKLFNKIKQADEFNSYQKKGLLTTRTLNLKENEVGVSNEDITGFVFEKYHQGDIKNIFRVENKSENQCYISFESKSYENWNKFKELINANFKNFSRLNGFYAKASILNYKDEFIWNGNDNLPVNEIFNIESEILNKKFLLSKNGTLLLMSQNTTEKPYPSEERTEISFNNDVKRIVIDHQYANSFNEIKSSQELCVDSKISDLFEKAHLNNKLMLKDILTSNTQDIINLK